MSQLEFRYDDVRSVAIRGHGAGTVTVRAAEQDGDGAGSVAGRLFAHDGRYLERVSVNQFGDQLRIAFPDSRFGEGGDVDVDLLLPEGLDLEVQTGSGDTTVTVPLGAAKITSGSGDIDVQVCGDIRASSGSGDIVIGQINGAAGQLTSGSGDISVGSTGSALQAKTASGDLNVLQLSGALRANTASGDIAVPHTSGSVELRSASGDISVGVADDLPAWLDLSSVSGEVRIDLEASEQPAEGDPYVSIQASTASGDIAVYRS